MKTKLPNIFVAITPIVVLIALLAVMLTIFKTDALSGGSQVALIFASALCVTISMACYKVKWAVFEQQLSKTFGSVAVTLFILLAVGMLAGTWMISGIVPTLIYYGLHILSPTFFLFCACLISALVSVVSGSSWTTIATIGVALLGIGKALGIDEPWTAGAIISGAYFGDKMSPLSDTTILASSTVGVDLFKHIRYMYYTTIPAFSVSLVIFLIAGFVFNASNEINVDEFADGLQQKFNISPWTLIVPAITGYLIYKRVTSLITLFLSALAAVVMAVVLQPDVLNEIAGNEENGVLSITKGMAITLFGDTQVEMNNETLNKLVQTHGMAGMLNTIWLIICAMLFGSVMIASRMVESITKMIIRMVSSRTSLVGATATSGVFLNMVTGDQFLSIILTADIYQNAYRHKGYNPLLLSRTTEDAASVTSVLIPWNSCGMTQAAVLGVPTLAYLPFCFFNLLSPIMSVVVAATGWKIDKPQPTPPSQ